MTTPAMYVETVPVCDIVRKKSLSRRRIERIDRDLPAFAPKNTTGDFFQSLLRNAVPVGMYSVYVSSQQASRAGEREGG